MECLHGWEMVLQGMTQVSLYGWKYYLDPKKVQEIVGAVVKQKLVHMQLPLR
jgi:hypothetical protein